MKRIYHHWTKLECYKAGFFNTSLPLGMCKENAELAYMNFLSDLELFEYSMGCVIEEWPNSCEQFLSNDSMNRIAWLGQSSMCLCTGVPSKYRGGFKLLTTNQQLLANEAAANVLREWVNQYAQG